MAHLSDDDYFISIIRAIPSVRPEDAIMVKRQDPDPASRNPTLDSHTVSGDPTLLPGGSRDLSFIGLQAFALGVGLASGICLLVLLAWYEQPLWRLPAFVACLSLFHFLEYWTTAAYNVPAVRASSFLLFNNGTQYFVAHTCATVEIVVSHFYPSYQQTLVWPYTIAMGTALVALGQVVRSVAMCQAGTNFNHTVATKHEENHVLVTTGLYSSFRHPSYFGFFWWALGTQILVGNKVCFVGYAMVLWNFFRRRIRAEEALLTAFFPERYEDYRKRVGTRIPLIQ